MSSVMPMGAGALLKHPSFLLFVLVRSLSRFSSQIGAVAIGWQVYDLTGSAFDLGLVGLVQFLPTALFLFVAGNTADRYQRQRGEKSHAEPDRGLPQRDRAAVLAKRPRDSQQREDAERRLQLQHDFEAPLDAIMAVADFIAQCRTPLSRRPLTTARGSVTA